MREETEDSRTNLEAKEQELAQAHLKHKDQVARVFAESSTTIEQYESKLKRERETYNSNVDLL